MRLTIKNIIESLEEEQEAKPTIVINKFWMRWLAKKMGIAYRKKMVIDTGYIIYVESQRIPLQAGVA